MSLKLVGKDCLLTNKLLQQFRIKTFLCGISFPTLSLRHKSVANLFHVKAKHFYEKLCLYFMSLIPWVCILASRSSLFYVTHLTIRDLEMCGLKRWFPFLSWLSCASQMLHYGRTVQVFIISSYNYGLGTYHKKTLKKTK